MAPALTALIILLVASFLLVLSAFISSRAKPEKSLLLLLFLHIPAITLWFLLTSMDFGAGSMANLVELLYLGIAAVVLPYIKVFLLDHFTRDHVSTTYGTVAFIAASAFLLRAFMPFLPE